HPQHESRGQSRSISGQKMPPPRPAHVDDRRASKQKPVRPGSLMAALGAATPTASELEEKTAQQTIEGLTHQSLLPKWVPSRRSIVISVAVIIAGLAGYAFLNRGGAGANISPAGRATPAAGFSGILVDIPLPTRR